MTYKTLMVHLQLGTTNVPLLQAAVALARQFDARTVGIAACQPLQIVYGDGYVSGELYEQDRLQNKQRLQAAEDEFQTAMQGQVPHAAWRSTVTYAAPADYLAEQARCADLVLTGSPATPGATSEGDLFGPSRAVNTSDLVMRVGRPVLRVPNAPGPLKLARVVVAWKDTREARRAVADALPLLKRAAYVAVIAVAPNGGLDTANLQLKDVAAWLLAHGVQCEAMASLATGNDGNALYTLAQDAGADVMVAGAYGHSRLREWALGGVTRDLLLGGERCAFLSH